MEQPKVSTSRLFVTSIIESKRDEIEEKLEQGYQTLHGLVSGLSEKEAHDALNIAVSRDKAHEEAVTLGLLCVILSEPQHATKSFRDLTLVTRDGLQLVMMCLSQLAVEKWLRMADVARSQLLWLLRELIRTGAAGVDNVCYNLMRHAAGGDVSPRNIALVDYMLDTFIENRTWLEKHPVLLSSMVYNYLRLIEDHSAPQFTMLRQKETSFVVGLLRDRFSDCMVIGRDLVRLLQNVARIPEIELLWRDILNNPKSLCPSFTGVLQLLQARTSRRFLQGRLTPEMERKVVFLTSHVRFGQHKRYQDWFQKQYLATPESQTLRIDLIRFIVGVIHPTNELLCSDIIPRWAIIGWLLTSCTSNVAAANAKLALFYDWLFFDTERDNIMNIEPAILVMHHSMRSHPVVTATLLDFLCRIIPNFYPPLSEKVRQGIYASLRHIMEKRVLSTLYTLFDHSRLDKELRVMVRETFQEFCYPHPSLEGVKLEESKEEMVNHLGEGVGVGMAVGGVTNHHSPSEPTFSDEEGEASIRPHGEEEDDDDIPLAKVKLKGSPLPDEWKDDDDEVVKNLEGPFRDAIERLQAETDNEAKCEAMERIVQLVIQDDEVDSDTLTTVGQCLCAVLRHTWTTRVFPETVTEDSIEDSIGRPLFVLFRNLAELSEDDSRRLPLLTVLSEMYSRCQRIGYLLLYYLQASTLGDDEGGKIGSNGKSQVFKELCETQDRELEAGLLADLKLCQEEDVNLLCWLLPAVYTQFPQVAVGNTALLHLVVSTVDARQLQELVCRVVQRYLKVITLLITDSETMILMLVKQVASSTII
ncbi:integrator complex subunit 3-like isoform X2 [Homalodisca vitripennis]|uniref:integrator complex subunit 3-like isoform X2 n=1 Tax=Homalodisca vitripennis TaxID=197043 RepID=UPI001EEC511C|nr:integrator complex subunit 3-like isoform X2 [Homalodisca vitripennis]